MLLGHGAQDCCLRVVEGAHRQTGGCEGRHGKSGKESRAPRRGDRFGGSVERECKGADYLIDQRTSDSAQQGAYDGAAAAAPITQPESECRTTHGADGRRDHDVDHDSHDQFSETKPGAHRRCTAAWRTHVGHCSGSDPGGIRRRTEEFRAEPLASHW
jgi:hypothetical protein